MGNDIAAAKLTPVVAVADGVVAHVVQNQGTSECCYAIIQHADGWQSSYIHLNNDLYGTDDGLGMGVRADLVPGAPVARGEVIGWVGDSGNAEETVSHLHFELRMPDGQAVDPRPSLLAAQAGTQFGQPQPSWPYADDDGWASEPAAGLLLTQGLLLSCDGTAVNFCPGRLADPELTGAVADHFAGKTTPRIEPVSRPDPSNPACPPDDCALEGVTEGDVARLAMWVRIDALVDTLRPQTPSEGRREVLLPAAGEADAMLRDLGARDYCNPPLDHGRVLTRAEAVTRLVAWLSGANPEPCPTRGT
jgi:hypothetical protein